MQLRTKAHIALLAANILYGMSFSAIKLLTTQYMPALSLNLVRVAATVPLFWLLFALKPSKAGIDKKDIGRFVACAITGVVINQLLFVKGISLTSSIHASILSLVSPIFITAAAGWLLKEAFTPTKGIGLTLGISGAALIILSRSTPSSPGENILLGDLLVTINAISYSMYFVLVKPLMNKYAPIHVLRWVFSIGFLFILPFGLQDLSETNFSAFTPGAWFALILVVFGMTFLGYLLNVFGLKHLGASVTGAYIYSQPIFAAVIGILLLGEKLSPQLMLAALLIGIGVFFSSRK